jgi:hypothetical protein
MKKILLRFVFGGFTAAAVAAPLITQQPNPSTNFVSIGASLTNRVAATSTNGVIRFQWQWEGVPLPEATNATFRLSSISQTNAGKYSVLIADSDGEVESNPWFVSVDGTFTKVLGDPSSAALRASGVAAGDVNNDGFPDLFFTGVYVSNVLFTNKGDGSFARVLPNVVASGAVASAGGVFGDYDNDGWADLFVSVNAPAPGNEFLYRNDRSALMRITSGPVVTSGGRGNGSAWADFDGDGNLDIYVCNSDQNNFLFRNNGNGSFTRLTTNSIVSKTGNSQTCAWGDFDNDGLPDLFVGKGVGNNILYRNTGGGNFTALLTAPMSKEGGGGGGVWVDYDNDGRLDLFVSSYGQKGFLYHNDGEAGFTKIVQGGLVENVAQSSGNVWADFDNDGFIDLFMTQLGGRNIFYRNNGDGTFSSLDVGSVTADGGECAGPVSVDINNDGFSDLVLANYRGNAGFIYRNNGNSNGWLTVTCEGRSSNRSAIGTKVRVRAVIRGRETWQLREIGCQSDLRAQFGLGDATNVDLRIEWPSGIRQEFKNVPAKQFLKVQEPSRLSLKSAGIPPTVEFVLAGAPGVAYEIEKTSDFKNWEPLFLITNSVPKETVQMPWTGNEASFFRAVEIK